MYRACLLALAWLVIGVVDRAGAQAGRPSLFLERDGAAVFLRVEEQRFNPLAGHTPARAVVGANLGERPGASFTINTPGEVLLEHVVAERMKHGIRLDRTGPSYIYDYRYERFDGDGGIYGAAIKLGAGGATNGATYVQRVFADAQQQPDASYHRSNTDFIGIETGSGPVFVRDVTARNFGDAGIDAKSGPVYVLNATISNMHRPLRAWPHVEIVIVNSIVNAAPGHGQIWISDASASVRYYNVLWCQGAETPSRSDPRCRPHPWLIEGDAITPAQASARVTELNADPLVHSDTFFQTRYDRIVIESSADQGAHWRTLAALNAGDPSGPPLGDLRYRIPPNLALGENWFRALCFNSSAHRTPVSSNVLNGLGGAVSITAPTIQHHLDMIQSIDHRRSRR